MLIDGLHFFEAMMEIKVIKQKLEAEDEETIEKDPGAQFTALLVPRAANVVFIYYMTFIYGEFCGVCVFGEFCWCW